MLLLLAVLFWVRKPNEMCSVHQIAINHIPLWIIPSDFRSIAVQTHHHLILLISDSYKNEKAMRLRFGYQICKLSMNSRMQQHLDANMPLICGNNAKLVSLRQSNSHHMNE